MSARDWRAVREGETHAAARTSTNHTPESFIVGVGASGALLAGAAIVFVTLVGLVSFNLWPTGHEVSVSSPVELSTATPGGSSAGGAAAPVSAASGQVASTSAGTTSGGNGNANGTGGGGNDQGGGKVAPPKSGGQNLPSPAPAPPSTQGSGDTGGSGGTDTNTPGNASKSPVNPVHPVQPETPHQSISDGTKGTEDGSPGGASDPVVTGKGPIARPPEPSRSGTVTNTGRGHESPQFRH